ncbi:SusC/RagA family TonB-linked outer membrane protein [Hymenobacter busanensis]|uniref:SusC/RagA family TonB-linked outer membrane protein n=1 Tax=Hymenobacter busanensis TaxID=2607656 RepID=A0A7L5A1L4_9BACT|nr:SusC/RagA family TonB-linked outer membrane protein [Hymenobacter busanensis]KAA9338167.1 SusC/RagA family TonB-linked outer membrane protein [Hymenobacter busanensis]QHJ09408.1 SusC/RagA family TonB-linked outer membrane protein [Hymenobacter busanensis]
MRNTYTLARLTLLLGWFFLCLLTSTEVLAQAGGAQAYTLQGRVTDERGQGLPGATVLISGTTLGTSTNADGAYTLPVQLAPGTYTLTFSIVGFKTQTRSVSLGAGPGATTDISLSEARQSLDDVVVIGSTISVNRRELGNAISTVKAQDIVQSGTGGTLNALQGKLPGAQIVQNSGDPSGSMSVRLRGIHSLRGSSDPLYVIDGVIVSNASTNVSQLAAAADGGIGREANPGQNRLADLNPNDIASINVINGAAAAAQYGSRASNGVVLITTKRGQAGAPRVSAYTSFNVNELRKSVPINTYGKQFGFERLRLYTIGVPTAQELAANPGTTTTGINRAGATAQLATNLVDVQRYDYFKEIFRTGTGTDNGISINGGSEGTQYLVSVGYLKNQGIIKGTDFTRYNVRARVDQRLTNWARATVGVAYNNSFANEKANGNVFYSPINSVNITNNIYDINRRDISGNLLAVEPTRVNPLSTIEDMKFTQRINRTIADLQVNLTPFKDISLDYILGVDTYSQAGQNYIRPYPYQAVAGLPLARYPSGFAANANNNVLQLNSDVNLGYNKQLTESLKLTLLAGYSYQYLRGELVRTQGQNQVAGITTVSGSASTLVASAYELDQFDLSGIFGQATIGYRNLAFLTGALRRDRSSKFSPSETNQYYPKVSGSLVVSDLGFWQNGSYNKAFSALKLRASYGEAGGLTAINSYDRFYQYLPVGFQGRNTTVPNARLANSRVRPERVAELEFGADLGFLNDRIGLGVSVYDQKTTDLVVDRSIAPSRGGSTIVENVARLNNKGVEVQLSASPVRTADFSWDVTLIYNRNRNKIVDLVGSAAVPIDNVAGAPVYLINGQPAGVFYGSAYARNPDGSLLLTPQGFRQDERAIGQGNGEIGFTRARGADGQPGYGPGTSIANVVIGDPNPDWTGSFNTSFTYKKVSLRVLVDAVQGVDVFNADYRTRQGVGVGEVAEKELRGELPRGYIFATYNTQEFRIDDGSFVKLRETALSYTLPSFSPRIRELSVALIGRNLYSWDDYKGFDPETSAGGSSDLLRAVDFGNVPIPRTYQLRLSASF